MELAGRIRDAEAGRAVDGATTAEVAPAQAPSTVHPEALPAIAAPPVLRVVDDVQAVTATQAPAMAAVGPSNGAASARVGTIPTLGGPRR